VTPPSSSKKLAPKRKKALVLRPPQPAAVMEVAFALAKSLSLDLREEELVGTFADALRRLLPGRLLCIRVIDPRNLALTSMIADGPLREGAATEPLALKRSALKRTRLQEGISSSGRVQLGDANVTVFAGTERGFSVPLVASGELFGVLNVEYPHGVDLAEADEPFVIPLANQLSVALRNLALLGEARYYRDFLRQMIDVANALITVIDREGRIVLINTAIQKYLGLQQDILGTHIDDIRKRSIAPEPRLGTLLLDGLRGVEHVDREISIMNMTTMELKNAVFSTTVLRAADGSIDGVIGIGQDRDRVRSLERQVIQAEKLATLGQLAAGVVHELNNPLTQISVYGDFLVKLLDKQPEQEKARKIVEGASRIQKLTRDLMTYARPAGEWELVALDEVVRQSITFCEHILRRSEARVVLRFDEELPRVRAIRSQLHQVMINLITNASHALPAPEQTISVRATVDPLDPRQIVVSVTDSGVGIDPLDQRRVFEPFFTTKKEGKGTGLGLSIVKNIVEAHGGHVRFESQPGHGTTFYITLPRAKEE
jgi:signal transduction histidine kinase